MARPRPFAWQGYLKALLVLCAWALLTGSFFAWLHKRLSR